MNTFSFQKVEQPAVDGLIAELKASGAAVSGAGTPANQITIFGHGITATATYDVANEVLTVVVTRKPFYVPVAVIQTQIAENLAKFGHEG